MKKMLTTAILCATFISLQASPFARLHASLKTPSYTAYHIAIASLISGGLSYFYQENHVTDLKKSMNDKNILITQKNLLIHHQNNNK